MIPPPIKYVGRWFENKRAKFIDACLYLGRSVLMYSQVTAGIFYITIIFISKTIKETIQEVKKK